MRIGRGPCHVSRLADATGSLVHVALLMVGAMLLAADSPEARASTRTPEDLTGGAFIVHAPAGVQWTQGEDWCAHYHDPLYGFEITSSYEQINRIDPGTGEGSVWYVLAAWEEDKEWCGFQFGLNDFDPGIFYFVEWSGCSVGGIELPTVGWPGPNEGTSLVSTGTPWSGNYEPLYWFGGYGYDGGQIQLTLHPPPQTSAGFTNCASPPEEFEAECLGALGIFTEGLACHPGPSPDFACCIGDTCQLATQAGCDSLAGEWQIGVASCDPNPCIEMAACCVGETCQILAQADCTVAGGDWLQGTESCDPNPCLDYACCVNETCQLLRQDECATAGGYWLEGIASCDPNPCFEFACCVEDSCGLLRQDDCLVAGGDWLEGIASCDPNPCLQFACCVAESCTVSREDECVAGGGLWIEGLASCDPNPCGDQIYLVCPDGSGDFTTIQAAIDFADDGDVIELCDTTFTGAGNVGIDFGGKAITVRSQSGFAVDCVIDCESTARGFNFHTGEDSTSILENVTIRGGHDNTFGGGIRCWQSSPKLTGVIFADNDAMGNSAKGGALHCDQSSPQLSDCFFDANIAEVHGGAVYCENSSAPTFTGCVFRANIAYYGGGAFFCDGSAPILAGCTLVANGSPDGNGLYSRSSSAATVMNTIIVLGSLGGEAVFCDGGSATLTCCDIYGNEGGDWTGCIAGQLGTNGNISEDPLFCDPDLGDYTLHSNSFCAPDHNPACGLIGALPVGCAGSGPPAAPSNLAVTATAAPSMLLAWIDNAPDELRQHVERKIGAGGTWTEVDTVDRNVTDWEDTDVVTGSTYYYRIRAWNEDGYSAYSNLVSALAGAPPAAPSALAAAPVSPVGIDLEWVDNADNEIGFHVQRRVEGAAQWTGLTPNPGANAESFEDRGLNPATAYDYRVRAYNAVGTSAWSDIASATTDSLPPGFSAEIIVRQGTTPIEGAHVFVDAGSGFVEQGITGPDGRVELGSLEIGNRLRAVARMAQRLAVKEGHAAVDSLMWTLNTDSDLIQPDGSYQSYQIEQQYTEYELSLVHPVFRYNLVVSVQWDIPTGGAYWTTLSNALNYASSYLYNVSDGQLLFGDVAVYDNSVNWTFADLQLRASDHPFAPVDGIFEPAAPACMTMGRVANGLELDHPGQYRKLVQLFGHYALGLYAEYLNGLGLREWWQQYRADHPDVAPANYGLMDYPTTTTENSSANDYLFSYPATPSPWTVTAQYFRRGSSCWDWLANRLMGYYPGIHITKPVVGWYPGNVTPDRLGPVTAIGVAGTLSEHNAGTLRPEPVSVQTFDSGAGGAAARLILRSGCNRAHTVHVYKFGAQGPQYLGSPDPLGLLDLVGLADGDQLRIYHRAAQGGTVTELKVDAALLAARQLDLDLCPQPEASGMPLDPDDTRAPGSALEAKPLGAAEEPTIVLSIWPDEPLGEDPLVFCYYGTATVPVPVIPVPGEEYYAGEITLDPSTPLFDGRGLFEVTLRDTLANQSVAIAAFVLGEAFAGEPVDLHSGAADLHLVPGTAAEWQLTLATATSTTPYVPPGFVFVPVTDVFSLHLADEDVYPWGAGLNVAYDDSALVGLDETSLALFAWDAPALTWTEVDSSLIGTAYNGVSAPVYAGGLFCVFATATSLDTIPPAEIGDFGGVNAAGQGSVELDWTSTGDDEMNGTAVEYVIAYADSLFTEETWPLLPKLPGIGPPQAAGTPEFETVVLPEEDHLYYLAIRARDEAGNLSGLSNITYTLSGAADPNIPPAAATNVRAVDAPADSGGVIALTWTLSGDDGAGSGSVTEYRIYRTVPPGTSPQLLDTVVAGYAAYTDETASTGAVYTYWVSASDGVLETLSDAEQAFAARNLGVPQGDFSSDERVGVDDFGLLVDTYGIDSTAVGFDPLFDLEGNGNIYTGDFDIFTDQFATGGIPEPEPPGQNDEAWVSADISAGPGDVVHLDVAVGGASNLAGYSFKITYAPASLTFVAAAPDSGGPAGNILNGAGGVTPLFLVTDPAGGAFWIANAIKSPTADSAPEGEGALARITFAGTEMAGLAVTDILLMDHRRKMNYRAQAQAVADAELPIRPMLFQNHPNPFSPQTRTTIRFELPAENVVSLKLYDVSGRLVRTLLQGHCDPGRYALAWDGLDDRSRTLGSGVYFYRLKTAGYEGTRKLMLLR